MKLQMAPIAQRVLLICTPQLVKVTGPNDHSHNKLFWELYSKLPHASTLLGHYQAMFLKQKNKKPARIPCSAALKTQTN